MSYITLKCKNCGSQMSLNTESHSATCVHCSSTFLLSEILDEKDMAFAEKFTPKNLEKKMLAQGAIKQGETFLFQAEFEKAEASFKRAIDLDDTNYKAYLGVVKAKTHNLNIIPDNDDYIQYAHYAISLANDDELVLVKSELAKIELLRHEKIRQKRIKASKKKSNDQKLRQARGVSKLTLFICVLILALIMVFLFISATFSTMVFEGVDDVQRINVSSYETLKKVFADTKYLNYEINLTEDIDCTNKTITPLGTKSRAFTGTFKGNNHTISNLKISPEPETTAHMGLFGYAKLANINNLIFDNVSLSIADVDSANSISSCGLLAGTIDSTVIKNIEIKENCLLQITDTLIYNELSVGGVIGKAVNSSHLSNISCHSLIANAVSQQSSNSNFYLGGIAGQLNNSDIQNTCSNSVILASFVGKQSINTLAYVGGISGAVNLNSTSSIANIKNNFFSGNIDTTTENVTHTISAITKHFATPTVALENYCLYSPTSFKINDSYISSQNLDDYALNNTMMTICNTNSIYMEKLNTVFSTWKNSETLTPSLA